MSQYTLFFPFQALHIFSSFAPLFEASDFIGPLGPGSIVIIIRLLLAFTINPIWPCYCCEAFQYLVSSSLFPRLLCPVEWENGERTIPFSRSWNVGEAICTKRSCDIVFLWKWKLWVCFRKTICGSYLNKVIVIWFSNPHHFLKMSKFR